MDGRSCCSNDRAYDSKRYERAFVFILNLGFKTSGAIPVEVSPGDVILHNILVLHGSPSSDSPLRRTVYFEYRSIDQELRKGPHVPEYIPLKQSTILT